jgi:hypothetical protein
MARERVSSPVHPRLQENGLMFRLIRVPPALDKFVQPLEGHFHWDHFAYFRLLVLTLALMWGRRNVATV